MVTVEHSANEMTLLNSIHSATSVVTGKSSSERAEESMKSSNRTSRRAKVTEKSRGAFGRQ